MKQYFRNLTKLERKHIAFLLAVSFPIFVLYNAIYHPWVIHPERAFFFGAILVITFVLIPLKSKGAVRGKIYLLIDLILIAAAIASATYIMLEWRYIIAHLGVPRPIDVVFGIMATLITLEATRRTMFALVPLCLAFLLYALFGHHLGGMIAAPTLSIANIMEQLYLQTSGLYGVVLGAALKYIVPFLVMGSLLKAMGAMNVLGDLASNLVGRTVGGPAKISVVTSSFFGMMSGSATANVAFTGTFTIPLMKKYGYKNEFAGAVEAASSTGGQMMPPIMGAVAFIMADYIGVPYVRIMLAGILPALLYYIAIFLRVHYNAAHQGLAKPSADIAVPSLREIAPRLIPLGIVFVVLIVALFTWTPTKAAVVTAATIIPLSFLRRETWLTPKKLIAGLKDATYSFLPIGAALLATGILLGSSMQTGLGLRFSGLMTIASAESVMLLLLTAGVACFIMGMGIGGIAVYIFAAIMIAPGLVELGVDILAAHFFIFYFANIQSITPPVCIATYTAASIANANPLRTGILGTSVAVMGFVIPFLLVFHPELLLLGSFTSSLMTFSLVAVGLVALVFMIEGYFNRQLSLWERVLLGLSAGIIFVQWNNVLTVVGVVLIGIWMFASIIIGKKRTS